MEENSQNSLKRKSSDLEIDEDDLKRPKGFEVSPKDKPQKSTPDHQELEDLSVSKEDEKGSGEVKALENNLEKSKDELPNCSVGISEDVKKSEDDGQENSFKNEENKKKMEEEDQSKGEEIKKEENEDKGNDEKEEEVKLIQAEDQVS